MRRRTPSWAALAVVAILLLHGCASPAPTPPPNAVVYFRNLSGSALLVGVTSGEFDVKAVLRPCGGQASFAVPWPPADDPRVSMGALYDATGAFDVLVAQAPAGSIDPDELGHASFTGIIWSRGDIAIADMPRWVTFGVGTTDVASAPPTNTTPPHCDPWPPSE